MITTLRYFGRFFGCGTKKVFTVFLLISCNEHGLSINMHKGPELPLAGSLSKCLVLVSPVKHDASG